jgi:hypothetical protein
MTQIAKFNATQVAVFGKIESVENTNAVPAAADVIIMTGVTYDPNIPTSSEALVGDFLSRDSVVNITDTFGDFSGDSYVPVLGSLVNSLVEPTRVVPVSKFLECCNLNAVETTTNSRLPSAVLTQLASAITEVTALKASVISVKNKLFANTSGQEADIVDDLNAWALINSNNEAAIKVQRDRINVGAVKSGINNAILDLTSKLNSLEGFKTASTLSIIQALVDSFALPTPATYTTDVIAVLGNLETTAGSVRKAISEITITNNTTAAAYKVRILANLGTLVTTIGNITGTSTAVTNFKAAVASTTALDASLSTLKFTNALASNSSLTAQIRKSSLDITEQKVVTLTGVRGTVDLNIKIAERPKFKFNFHGNEASILNSDSFITNINEQKTNIAPVTLNSNIERAVIASGNVPAADIADKVENISFISFSASNFDGFDLKRTQTGSGDFWYPQAIAHDVMITILEDTARVTYTGGSTTTSPDATSFRPEDNVGKEFTFYFRQGDAAGASYCVYMNKLTLKGYKHTTQGNVASIDLTFEASGVSELTLL